MRSAIAVAVMGVATSFLTVAPVSTPTAVADVTQGVTAMYEMNEPQGSTVMIDSSGNGNDGQVNPAGVETGGVYDGATAYNWPFRSPTAPPASPERVVQVPDDIALEPGGQDFTIEIRIRFTDKFGNVAQKGQAQTAGGQWKIQAPQGIPSCLFKGSAGQVSTGAQMALDDGSWHTLTCVLTSTGVSIYVDGVLRNKKNGTAGTVDNSFPMTVGGKIECDQIDVTCDYFSGQIDYIKITKGPNLAPTASFASSCPSLTCAFDAGGSSDPDGNIASYAWSFGDGTTGTGPTPTHIFTESGTYRVRLTVTDNRGATDVSFRDITVEGVPVVSNVAYVDSAVGVGNNATPSVVIPATASVGDRLLLVFSMNSTSRTFTDPAGVTGFAKLDTNIAKTMSTTVWTKTLEPGDPGATVTVPLTGGLAKYTLTAAVYAGVDDVPTLQFGHAIGLVDGTTWSTPQLSGIADGSWVVSYWSDKSSSTTAWTPSSSVTTRAVGCGTSSARICSAMADSRGKVPAVYGSIAATVNAPTSAVTMWSIVLPTSSGPPPPNQEPVADFASACTSLACEFDSSTTTDDGDIVSHAWDFGDGGTSTAADPSHDYAATGTYDVTLTVTDNGGLTDSVTKQVAVEEDVPTGDVTYVGSAIATSGAANPSVRVPASVAAGDRLLLVLSLNSDTRTFTDPTGVTGWTKLDTVVAKTMSTTVWTKVASAGDADALVSVALSGAAKSTLTVAGYAGAEAAAPAFAVASDVTNTSTRQAPAVTVPAGSWVASYWADKSSTTTAWSADPSVVSRAAGCASSSGRVCSLLADSGTGVSGAYGPISASTDAPSSTATMWSIVLVPETAGP
jgi:PKD repeat protein